MYERMYEILGRVWRFGRVDAFRPKDHGFDSRFSRHVGTLGKSFTHSCLWRFRMKFRHSVHVVSGAPLSISETKTKSKGNDKKRSSETFLRKCRNYFGGPRTESKFVKWSASRKRLRTAALGSNKKLNEKNIIK